LRETYPGSWEDFNALIMYLGMIGSLALWDMGLDLMLEKKADIPAKESTERREMMAKILSKFLEELVEKTEDFGDNALVQKQVTEFCENFRRNL
jgi:hypothetical protein